MREYVAVVFDQASSAQKALDELWRLDEEEQLTVYGAGVITRSPRGGVIVEANESPPPLATVAGLAAGAFLGLFAGPAGAGLGAAGGAAIGAAAGTIVGLGTDVALFQTTEQAVDEVRRVMHNDQHAVIADVDETTPAALDSRMHSLAGTVYRRRRSDVRSDKYAELDRALTPYPPTAPSLIAPADQD